MNNKGQSLIAFILIIPILLLILFMVYEIGKMTLLKTELDNINYMVMDYGVSKLNDVNIVSDLQKLIARNRQDIDNVEVSVSNGQLKITLEETMDDISMLKRMNVFKVKSEYIGYIDGEKKIIKKG